MQPRERNAARALQVYITHNEAPKIARHNQTRSGGGQGVAKGLALLVAAGGATDPTSASTTRGPGVGNMAMEPTMSEPMLLSPRSERSLRRHIGSTSNDSYSPSGVILACLLAKAGQHERESHVPAKVAKAHKTANKRTELLIGDAAKGVVSGLASPIFSPTTSPTLSGTSDDGNEGSSLADFELDGLEELDTYDTYDAPLKLEPMDGVSGTQLGMTEASAQLVVDAYEALSGGGRADLLDGGISGTYVVRDVAGTSLAIFKPCDEEAGTIGGREDTTALSASVQRGCAPGEGAKREYLAYMLDQESPPAYRANVPETALVRMRHPALFGGAEKVGSLMRFVANRGGAEDFGASSFALDNVQRLALFDLRTLNLDRHGGNILVDSVTGNLVPIDHGCAFPSELGEPWLDWRLWRQAEMPLDEGTRAFIRELDPLAAASLSAELGLPDGVWRTVAVMTLLLQACLGGGAMTLRQVADLTMNRFSDAGKGTEISFVEKLGSDLMAADHAAKAVESEEWPWPGNAGQVTFVEHCKAAIEGRRAVAAIAA